jgi:hypothetical protein
MEVDGLGKPMEIEVRTPQGFPLPHGIVVKWEDLEYHPEIQAWTYSIRMTDTPLPEDFWGRCEHDGVSVINSSLVPERGSVVEYIAVGDITKQPRHIAFRTWGAIAPAHRKDDLVAAIRRGAIPLKAEGAPFAILSEEKVDPEKGREEERAQSTASAGSHRRKDNKR